jgi:hypothetical protein
MCYLNIARSSESHACVKQIILVVGDGKEDCVLTVKHRASGARSVHMLSRRVANTRGQPRQ